MKKESNDIAALAAELSGNTDMASCMETQAKRTALVYALTAQRVRLGLTQKDVAERMGVSVSTVSRFESGCDLEMKLGDFVKYAGATNMRLSLMLDNQALPAATRIKHLVFAIASDLDQLSSLAKEASDDSDILQGIQKFRSEVLLNFLVRYQKTGEGFPTFSLNSESQKLDSRQSGEATASLDNKKRTPICK